MFKNTNLTNTLIAALRTQGLRMTRPRQAILDMLERSQYPLNASEVHAQLKREKVSVDLATIYRTLTMLKEMELISSVEFQEGQFRYELRHGRQHHHHIRCKGCGRIADLLLCPLKKLAQLVERETRFLVEDHTLEFVGRCPKCR